MRSKDAARRCTGPSCDRSAPDIQIPDVPLHDLVLADATAGRRRRHSRRAPAAYRTLTYASSPAGCGMWRRGWPRGVSARVTCSPSTGPNVPEYALAFYGVSAAGVEGAELVHSHTWYATSTAAWPSCCTASPRGQRAQPGAAAALEGGAAPRRLPLQPAVLAGQPRFPPTIKVASVATTALSVPPRGRVSQRKGSHDRRDGSHAR
jgi:hypothetical protein